MQCKAPHTITQPAGGWGLPESRGTCGNPTGMETNVAEFPWGGKCRMTPACRDGTKLRRMSTKM